MDHPIHVALLATAVKFGGVDRVLANLVRYMDAGVQLSPILFTRTDTTKHPLFDTLAALNVQYERIFISEGTRRLTPLRDLRQTVAQVRNRRVDLVHSHGYRADVLGFVAAKYLGLPIVSTCHGYISGDRRVGFYNRLDVMVLRYFDQVVAVSDRLRAQLIEHGVDERRVQTVVNAVGDEAQSDQARIRRETRVHAGIAENEFVFGFVGRLEPEKGLTYLLEALSRLADERFRLLVVGDGPQRGLLERATAARSLGRKVLFAGFQEDPAAWYPAMDVFVLPSVTEGTPMALLEAMASGLPVIATSVGGVPSIVASGDNGLLVPAADVPRLSQAMHALATDPRLRLALGESARGSVRERFDARTWARKMHGIYQRLVDGRRAAMGNSDGPEPPTTTKR